MIGNKITYLWLDVETTGLDTVKNDVVQIACIPIIDGEEADKAFNQFCQPFNYASVDPVALQINHLSMEKLRTFQEPTKMVDSLIGYLRQFNVKFTMAGYNVGFDRNFLSATFRKAGREREFAELFTSDIRDVLKRTKAIKKQLDTPNVKLETLAKHFNIEINAHDALSDIRATIEVDKIVSNMLGDVETETADIVLVDNTITFPNPAQLHCHSTYSYTDSTPHVSEWVEWCLENKAPAFSIVDHGSAASLFEMTRISDLIKGINKKKKTQYKEDAVVGIPGSGLLMKIDENTFHINAWATSNLGYKNLLKLSSVGWLNKITVSNVDFPVVTLDDAIKYSEDIIFGIPGLNGPATSFLKKGDQKGANTILQELQSSLDIRLELASINTTKYYDSAMGFMSYGCNMQQEINKFYYDFANKNNLKCVPVSDAHYLNRDDKIIQDCISKNSYKDSRYFFESRHQTSVNEMFSIIKSHIPSLNEAIFKQMIENTHEIAQKAASIKIKREYHLPAIEIPDDIKSMTDDYNMQTYYLTMQKAKAHGRWNNSPEYVERFKREIDVIMKNATLNFLPYFLVYEDICAYARSSGLLQNIARGSAGGSLLSYYLKIIHVDPVAANLPFERFLSHARIRAGSFPDIDLDIADRARPMVVKYLQEKYSLGFAQVATFNKMKTKNAIKDAMYALYGRNRNDPEVKMICDSIPDSPQGVNEHDFLYGYVDQEGVEHEGAVHANEILRNFFEQRPEVESMVKKLIGSIRGWSRHASAFVISTIDLSSDRVPTMLMDDKELGNILVTQYDAPMVEKSGLVKADILGIKTLTMTSDCVNLIKKNHNVDLLAEDKGVPYIYRLPEDPGVFADFYNKDTDSSFQFNTELIKGYIQEFCPTKKSDLAAMTALCRPGALDAPFEDTTAAQFYMDVRNGARKASYLHPDLEPILKESNSVFVYQEEVMRFLVEIAGFSWEESDVIRSAIAKKKHEVIMATFDRIRASCTKRGWSKEAIETICQQIMAFSRYSFNKSHSYAYAELGYITMWLKHHFPLEWWCSVLNNEDKEDKVRVYISYLGDKVRPPSLKNPKDHFVIGGEKIVAPISVIKGIGPSVVNELVTKGPFDSLDDYIDRIDHSRVNIGAISAMIKARAADDMMDQSISDYKERRTKFMKDYCARRKSKTEFKPEMYEYDPVKLFIEERDTNQCFNRSLLSDTPICDKLQSKLPALIRTKHKAVPFVMGDAMILANLKIAENVLKKGDSEKEYGMFMLFKSSTKKSGVSKKTGKEWSCVSMELSDGYTTIEATDWKRTKAVGLPVDSIIYVRGILKPGWKTPVSITISEMEPIV
jgi:DNA polymerase-3 subunit alpha